jgi:flagella basal body P-ring formation protein FlgA
VSRTWILSFVLAALVSTVAAGAAGAGELVTPEQAIERAIAQRIGQATSIAVTALETTVRPERALQAVPDPAGRAGQPMRFVLLAGRVRRGVATATVHVVAAYARATRAIARDERVTGDAFEVIEGTIPGGSLKRLPAVHGISGLIARRDIAPGEVLGPAVLDVPPDVRSGEPVVLTVVIGAVRLSTNAVAAAAARVSGPGAVEIRQ